MSAIALAYHIHHIILYHETSLNEEEHFIGLPALYNHTMLLTVNVSKPVADYARITFRAVIGPVCFTEAYV